MLPTWKSEQRKALLLLALLLAFLSFLVYWQGNLSVDGFTKSFFALLSLDFASIAAPYDSLLLDLSLLLIGSTLSFLFFAHFVVPIQSKSHLLEVAKLMARSLLGKKPSTINLRNGKSITLSQMSEQKDASLILLDIASAAVLRNEQSFTRAIGPGLHLLDTEEKLAGSLDLRIQRRSIGPLSNENPFANQAPSEDKATYLARQKRREESTGLTRDGVEIVPRIEVRFMVEGRRPVNTIPFPFHPEFAWRTIANEAVFPNTPSDVRKRQIHWDWLPAQLAGDLWRVFLRKYRFEEIFEEAREDSLSTNGNGPSGLAAIEQSINARLSSALVDNGEGKNSSPEYQLLRNRGIKALSVKIREVYVDPHKEEMRLVNEWSESWELHAIQKGINKNATLEHQKSRGTREAAKEFVQMVSEDLLNRLLITDGEKILPPDEDESLSLLIEGTLRNAEKNATISEDIFDRLTRIKSKISAWGNNES